MNIPIVDLLLEKKVFSVEFFPPKTEESAKKLLKTAEQLKDLNLDFVSITYGAGGSTRALTLEYTEWFDKQLGFNVMPHLTCVGHTEPEIRSILDQFRKEGVRNLMLLRGDLREGNEKGALSHASDLVQYVRRNYPEFCIGVAGYPEKHPESKTFEEDISWLKHKIDCGADFITTQMFFDNQDYFCFVERCRNAGINVPIMPGILPVVSFDQLKRFSEMCGANIPLKLKEALIHCGEDADVMRSVGLKWACEQVSDLLAKNVPGIHLYVLNRAEAAMRLFCEI